MKNQIPISALLGITQLELAMLLKVSRPLITLYESGERELPTHAKHLLADIVKHLDSEPVQAKRKAHSLEREALVQDHLRRMLTENEYKSLVNANNITKLEKKLEGEMRRPHLVAHLKTLAESKQSGIASPLRPSIYIAKPSKLDRYALLTELKIKQELLAYENTLLISKLKEIAKTDENKGIN